MNETQTRRGPNLGLLLLIPAAVIIAKTVSQRRAMMMESGWSGPGGRRYGRHGFAGAEDETGARSFQIPPWIEPALDAWHTRAHKAPDPTEPEAGTATA